MSGLRSRAGGAVGPSARRGTLPRAHCGSGAPVRAAGEASRL